MEQIELHLRCYSIDLSMLHSYLAVLNTFLEYNTLI